MLKDATTEQERTLIRKNIAQIASNLSEDDALVLTFLFFVHKNGCGAHFATAKEIIARTRIQRTRARMSISRLSVPNFISKEKVDHSWHYTISQDGAEALNYLLDKNRFPGRKIKFEGILTREVLS